MSYDKGHEQIFRDAEQLVGGKKSKSGKAKDVRFFHDFVLHRGRLGDTRYPKHLRKMVTSGSERLIGENAAKVMRDRHNRFIPHTH